MSSETPTLLPTTSEYTDDELLGLIRSGQVELFAVLVRRYNQRLYRVARGITRDEHEAEDVVQQSFVSAYQHLSQFLGTAQFSTWLTRIAVNESLARVRKRKRNGETELTEVSEPISTEGDPEVQVSNHEMTRMLEKAIDELPTNARVVLMMRDIQELNTNDTAEILDISCEAVRVRLHRARAMLRTSLLARFEVSTSQPFVFAGARCDRIVSAVFDVIRH